MGGMAGGFLTVYAVRRWHLSDGQAGLFTMSLAFNGDEGLEAKVHVGMTLGL